MVTVWKYELNADVNVLSLPRGAQFLQAQVQYGMPIIWALVDPECEPEERRLLVVGTGEPFQAAMHDIVHRGTFQMDNGHLVYHVFEVFNLPF